MGLVFGLVGSVALAGALSSLLFGVASHPAVLTDGCPTVLAIVAFLGTYVPARRGARLDPLAALHQE